MGGKKEQVWQKNVRLWNWIVIWWKDYKATEKEKQQKSKRIEMAKISSSTYSKKKSTKRAGVHSKNASKNQNGWKKKYKGQGK